MKRALSASFFLCLLVIAGYSLDAIVGRKTVGGDWIMPLASIATVFVIPVAWVSFARSKKEERGSVIPHIALFPFWLHGVFASVMLVGWLATGGL
ncbi:hypothetical protein [Congregicoccus parvus]|uniref:hypothetical protein n=1 Tax=Congregicoccus parvus TaxID=3081749 RepID=UPI003FA59145